jgi:RimJ/RimL family protein N-acetyltransferase
MLGFQNIYDVYGYFAFKISILRLKRNDRFYVSYRYVGSEFWGTGVFADGARLTIGVTFDALGAHRLEARAALANGRGNAALRKLGASREGILLKSFLRHGEHHDQALWTIPGDEWRDAQRTSGSPRIH